MDKNLLHNKHCLLAKKSYKNAHNCASKLKKNVDPCEDMDLRRKRKKNRNKIKCLMTSSASKRKPKNQEKNLLRFKNLLQVVGTEPLTPETFPNPLGLLGRKPLKRTLFIKKKKIFCRCQTKLILHQKVAKKE